MEALRTLKEIALQLPGRGQDIQQVIQQIRQVANSNFTVLLQGETGTGKELVARSIHQPSARRNSSQYLGTVLTGGTLQLH